MLIISENAHAYPISLWRRIKIIELKSLAKTIEYHPVLLK